jgi:hypothetical protein
MFDSMAWAWIDVMRLWYVYHERHQSRVALSRSQLSTFHASRAFIHLCWHHPSIMATPTQQSFRSQLSGFRWANSVQDDSAPPAAAPSTNPFSRFYNTVTSSVSDYVPLRSGNRSDEEEAYFALSVSIVACSD